MSNDTASAITDLDTYMRDLTDDEARTIREVAERVKARGDESRGYVPTVCGGGVIMHTFTDEDGDSLRIERASPQRESSICYLKTSEIGMVLSRRNLQRLRAICDLCLAGRFDEAAEIGGGVESCEAVVNDGACGCAVSAATGYHDYAATLALDGLRLPIIVRENAMYLDADQAERIGRALLACAAKKREG
jgi:hypothetical protein